MFGLSQFNLAGFNLLADQQTVRYAHGMYASVGAMVSNGGDEYLQESMTSDLRTQLSAGPAEKVEDSWTAQVLAETILIPTLQIQTKMAENMQAQIETGLDMYLHTGQESHTLSKAEISCDLFFWLPVEAQTCGEAEIGCDIYMGQTIPALLNAQVSTYIVENLSAFLNVTIPPGGTLVIDSENYNVLLNGQSVIWTHTGDWIWISRETMDITVSSGVGKSLESRILYTERFL